MKTGKVLLGVLAGVAAGAVLGILFAPEKGSHTRRKILDKGEDYADGLKDKMDNLCDTMTNKYEMLQDLAKDLVANGKVKYDDTRNGIASAYKDAKSIIS